MIVPDHPCPCHGVRGTWARRGAMGCIVKRRIRTARYHATTKGAAAKRRASARFNPRRIGPEGQYGQVATPAEARAINAYIRRRKRDFQQAQQCLAETPDRNRS